MSTIVMTGASGFIGQHVARLLLERGDSIISLSPHPEKLDELGESFPQLCAYRAGFEDFLAIGESIELAEQPDTFCYLAWGGYGSHTNDYRVQLQNIQPACDAVCSAASMGCKRFVFATSFYEWSVSLSCGEAFDDPYTVYGSAKRAARMMAHAVARQKGIEFVSVAFSNIFGPGDRSRRSTNSMIHQLLKGEDLSLTSGVHLFDWCYVEDAARGTVAAMDNGVDGAVYYVGGDPRPFKDIVAEVRDVVAPTAAINLGAYEETSRVAYELIDIGKLKRDTGFQARADFGSAVSATADWVRSLFGGCDGDGDRA